MLWHEQDQATGPTWVEEGAPVGQFYGLGGSWTKWKDLPEITKGLGRQSPARAVGLFSRIHVPDVRIRYVHCVHCPRWCGRDALAGSGGEIVPEVFSRE